MVGEGRQELADQGTVPQLQLDAVKLAFHGIPGADGEIFDALLDILDLHGLAGLPKDGILAGRRPPHRQAGDFAVPLHAVVVELCEDLGVVFVNGAGEPLEPRNHVRFIDVHQLVIGVIRGMDAHLLGDDQADAALGPLPVIIDMPVADQIVHRVVGHVGGKIDPVGHHRRADFEG